MVSALDEKLLKLCACEELEISDITFAMHCFISRLCAPSFIYVVRRQPWIRCKHWYRMGTPGYYMPTVSLVHIYFPPASTSELEIWRSKRKKEKAPRQEQISFQLSFLSSQVTGIDWSWGLDWVTLMKYRPVQLWSPETDGEELGVKSCDPNLKV